MKTVKKLSLLATALILASCNEKVSPELMQSNASTPGTSTPVPPTEYYFSVVNTSDALLNYKLHKTGIGNASTKCEVRNTTGLSNDIFRGAPAANDITCFMEAEELSLFHAGFKWEIQASQNTCDFVGYQPYGFYDRIPGDSTSNLLQISCGEETDNTHVATSATALGLDITDSTPTDLGCGDWASQDIASGTRIKFQNTSDEELCRFNYKDGENEKCDIGTVTVNELQVNYTPATADSVAILKYEMVPRVIRCGGAIANCVQGPTKDISEDHTSVTEITQTKLNEPFALEYEYEPLIGKQVSTKKYANFRRNLSSTNIDFISTQDALYADKWGNTVLGRIFEPRVVDYFSANKQMDGTTPIVSNVMISTEANKNRRWTAKPLAADPMMGLAGRVNPFYTFYCFDTAFDMKARIKVMVRDWDRVFPAAADMEYLSDLWKTAGTSRQDIPGIPELPDDQDPWIPFNDLGDWDDFIPMERTPGVFNLSTIWRPIPVGVHPAGYPEGFFNPSYFTNNNY